MVAAKPYTKKWFYTLHSPESASFDNPPAAAENFNNARDDDADLVPGEWRRPGGGMVLSE